MKRRGRVGCWIVAAVPLLVGGAVLLSVGLQSPTWRVERTRTVRAAPDRVRDVVSDVRELGACCMPSIAGSSSAPTVFSERSSGRGAWIEWGEPGARERGTIEAVGPNRVTMRFDVAGRASRQLVEWRPTAGGDGTAVTWVLEGDKSGFLARLLWPLVALTGRFTGIVDRQLDGLDRATRTARAPSSTTP